MNTLRRKQTTYQFNSVFSIFYWSDGLIKNSLSRISKARTKPSLTCWPSVFQHWCLLYMCQHKNLTRRQGNVPSCGHPLFTREQRRERNQVRAGARGISHNHSFQQENQPFVTYYFFQEQLLFSCFSLVLKICGKRFFQTAQARVDAMVLVD